MKIYIVVMGEYSDKHIERVFLNKEKAEYWAEAQNDFREHEYYGKARVLEYETSDESVEISGRRVPTYHYEEYRNYWGDQCLAIPGKRVDNSLWGDGTCHYFSEKPLTDEEAEKIFRDMQTRLQARKEGLI